MIDFFYHEGTTIGCDVINESDWTQVSLGTTQVESTEEPSCIRISFPEETIVNSNNRKQF